MHALPLWLILSSSLLAPAAPPAEDEAPVIALRDVAPEGWQLKPLKVGSPLWLDREYSASEISKGLEGATMLVRGVADNRKWLEPAVLAVKGDCCVYVLVRWKFLGKADVDAEIFPILATQGWTTCEEKFESTINEGEEWGWTVLKKELKKGEKVPRLKDLNWKVPVVFVFKASTAR
jgi:hypothetical protein